MLEPLYSSVLNHPPERLAPQVSRNVVESIRDQGLVAPAAPPIDAVRARPRIDLDYPTSVQNAPRRGHGRTVPPDPFRGCSFWFTRENGNG